MVPTVPDVPETLTPLPPFKGGFIISVILQNDLKTHKIPPFKQWDFNNIIAILMVMVRLAK